MNLQALTTDRLSTLVSLRKASLSRVSDRGERRAILLLLRAYHAELATR